MNLVRNSAKTLERGFKAKRKKKILQSTVKYFTFALNCSLYDS